MDLKCRAQTNEWLVSQAEDIQDKLEALNPDSDSEHEDENAEFHDIGLFCHAIGEPQLVEKFIEHKVALSQLLHFNEQDLVNCGIDKVGERKKVLASIGQMHSEKWSPTSLNDMTEQSLLSSPGIYLAINDINKHLEYIGVTFVYLRKKLDANPDILELGKDFVGVRKIAQELVDLTKTSAIMHSRLIAFDKHVSKYKDRRNLQPANHIDESYIRSSNLKNYIVSLSFGMIVLCASLKFIRW